jgi:hypothetical protein
MIKNKTGTWYAYQGDERQGGQDELGLLLSIAGEAATLGLQQRLKPCCFYQVEH